MSKAKGQTSKVEHIDIDHVAKLANLPLTASEKQKFTKQLEETLTYIQKLNEVDIKNAEPTSQVTGLENVLRDDETLPSLNQDQVLANTKSTHNGFFQVKAILEEE